MMFARLKAVRELLASVTLVTTDPATVQALMDAIDELDDAMVADTRAMNYARDNPPSSPPLADSFDVGHFAKDMVMTMNRVRTLS